MALGVSQFRGAVHVVTWFFTGFFVCHRVFTREFLKPPHVKNRVRGAFGELRFDDVRLV
jgi:hypothetical protein